MSDLYLDTSPSDSTDPTSFRAPPDPPHGPPLNVGVAMRDTLAGILDTMTDVDRVAGGVAAARATLIESARLMSEALAAQQASDGAQPLGREPKGWNSDVRLRRELVFDIAVRLRIPERTAENLIGESAMLAGSLTRTHAALADGQISYRHAQVIIDVTAGLDPETRTGFEAELLPAARELTVAKFAEFARRLLETQHPEQMGRRHRDAVQQRTVSLDPQRDGMSLLSALLPAETAAAAHDRLTRVAMGLAAPDEKRTLAQRRADVLADLLIDGDTGSGSGSGSGSTEALSGESAWAGSGAAARGIRPQVLVTIPVLTLLGHADVPGHLNGYGPVSPDTARQLTLKAPSFARVLTDPVTSAVLDFDRSTYSIPADLRAVITLQHETCAAPGCNRPAHQCDIDHTVDYALGGTTSLANLAPLSRDHHNLKHHSGIGIDKNPDGSVRWTTATGFSTTVRPTSIIGDDMLRRGTPGTRPEWEDAPEPEELPF